MVLSALLASFHLTVGETYVGVSTRSQRQQGHQAGLQQGFTWVVPSLNTCNGLCSSYVLVLLYPLDDILDSSMSFLGFTILGLLACFWRFILFETSASVWLLGTRLCTSLFLKSGNPFLISSLPLPSFQFAMFDHPWVIVNLIHPGVHNQHYTVNRHYSHGSLLF